MVISATRKVSIGVTRAERRDRTVPKTGAGPSAGSPALQGVARLVNGGRRATESVTSGGCFLPRVDERDPGVDEVLDVARGKRRSPRAADGSDLAVEAADRVAC